MLRSLMLCVRKARLPLAALLLMLALLLPRAAGAQEGFSLFAEGAQTPAAPETPAALTVPAASAAPASGFSLEIIPGDGTRKANDIRVLIYHSHTYEAYTATSLYAYKATEKWRTADETRNVTAVGARLAELLRSAGLSVTHDTTAFEPPALSNAYERSRAMLEARAQGGESYDLYIDLHRDAYAENNGANTVEINGEDAARLMFLIGKGTGQTNAGYDQRPEWEKNLALAQRLTDAINLLSPGLCRNVAVKSGRYNQHIAPCCVLLEVGNNRNTLEEALAAMPHVANAVCAVLK